MIALNKIDREEAVRYLGNSGVEMNSTMEGILDICEEKILATAKPKYLYKTVALENSGLLVGNSICKHLENCQNAVILCATLGADIDKLIRTAQVTDMAQAVVIDSMSSVAVEQICNRVEELIIAENPTLFTTWRFSPGYGDYPIELQSDFL
ncbi:MAG: methionine synthase, partial [Ruminococcus sp.]